MKNSYFPRSKAFWYLHCTALLLIGLMQGTFILVWREHQWFDATSSLIWLFLFTLAALGFRFQYQKRRWENLDVLPLMMRVILSALIIGLTVSLIMLAVTLPFYWNTIFAPDVVQEKEMSITAGLLQLVFNNAISTTLFASAWLLAYITLTHNRRIRRAKLEHWKLENHLQEARLNRLTSQLNPHFLFNSLNNIRFTIHENPHAADRAITALSDLLRHSLESDRKDKVPLHRELEVVDQYLDIMRLQLEHRLSVSCAIPKTLHDCLIPPMSLQMLIENAVKHGIEPSQTPGNIELNAEASQQHLVLTISNSRPKVPNRAPAGTRTGLANITQRLNLIYGPTAHLAIREEELRFTATLTVPREYES